MLRVYFGEVLCRIHHSIDLWRIFIASGTRVALPCFVSYILSDFFLSQDELRYILEVNPFECVGGGGGGFFTAHLNILWTPVYFA